MFFQRSSLLATALSSKAMQPTANSVAFIRETPAIQRFVAAADGGH